jgi:DNA-binding MarR family transcriptional regulator
MCLAQAKARWTFIEAKDRTMKRSLPARRSRASRDDVLTYDFTLHVRDQCLCLHVQRAARALARRFDDALGAAGLTSGQFSLLISLNRAEAATISSVAALLAMDRTSLTANLKPLQRRKLVAVTADPNDKRSRRVVLTPAGRALLVEAAPLWKRAHAETERLVNGNPGGLRATLRALHQP